MKLKSPHLWIAFFSALGVALIAAVDARSTSPGELSAVHGRVDELDDRGSCSECHGGWAGSMTSACLDCHETIDTHITESRGLHGVLPAEEVRRCARCHSEHHGTGFGLVNRLSFVRAGVDDPAEFEHDRVGFAMAGKHLELECTECHAHASTAILPEGATRYVGLAQDCSACHEDAHEGRYVLSCASCHGQEAFTTLASQGHDEHLPLIGGHGDVACADCHTPESVHSLDSLGIGRRPTSRACQDCHESPHAAEFTRGAAALADLAPAAGCVECHAYEHTTFREELLSTSLTDAQHACSGFALDEPHDELECADCHAPSDGDFAARYPGRGADECSACHDDPHGGQFATGPFSGGDCIACHDRGRFEPHAFTVEDHSLAALVLDGSHLDVECEACHVVPEQRLRGDEVPPRVFRGSPSLCEGCHADAHDGFFARFATELASAPHGACEVCHVTTTFAELPPGGFDHGRFAGFVVDGAHAQGECTECHPLAEEEDELGRSFGRVAEHFGEIPSRSSGCAVCHTDPHAGTFDEPGLPRVVDGRTDCARCHETSSFRAFPRGFAHGGWTGFPLDGRHAEVGCSFCHAPLFAPDAQGRTWQEARGTACADCHADPHGGQFRVSGQTDCARCHRSAASFAELRFDHELHSRFPLGDAHSDLACSECHHPIALGATGVMGPTGRPGDAEIVRYRPLGFECTDCHGEHEDVLLRRKGRKP